MSAVTTIRQLLVRPRLCSIALKSSSSPFLSYAPSLHFCPSSLRVLPSSSSPTLTQVEADGPVGKGSSLIDVNPPRGTRDFPPDDMRLRSWLFQNFREVSRILSFEEVDFPVLESEALFIRKAGEEITQQLLKEKAILPDLSHKVDDIVFPLDEVLDGTASSIASSLRKKGRSVDLVEDKRLKWLLPPLPITKRYVLGLFISLKHITANVVDRKTGRVAVSASSVEKSLKDGMDCGRACNVKAAAAVGEVLAVRLKVDGLHREPIYANPSKEIEKKGKEVDEIVRAVTLASNTEVEKKLASMNNEIMDRVATEISNFYKIAGIPQTNLSEDATTSHLVDHADPAENANNANNEFFNGNNSWCYGNNQNNWFLRGISLAIAKKLSSRKPGCCCCDIFASLTISDSSSSPCRGADVSSGTKPRTEIRMRVSSWALVMKHDADLSWLFKVHLVTA
ncbi:Histidine--tRNA ligase [Carex littledalei]|uniref:histidine--tRNA ligase n=1 Tax=Carex littledalei TaxID=544730 RepID=A0A833V6Q0_9POAL|nr:Histidine--tRNA ligase [Carex littledalei]